MVWLDVVGVLVEDEVLCVEELVVGVELLALTEDAVEIIELAVD